MKELKKLISVRTIITLALTATLIYGFAVNKIDSKDFLVYVTMVFTFFFAKTGQEKAQEEIKENIQEQQTNKDEIGKWG